MIEVNGRTVYSIIDGFGTFKSMAIKYLLNEGIGSKTENGIELKANDWYPMDGWLRAFQKISKEVGSGTLYRIGNSIPKNAAFPPWVNDVFSAVKSIDIAYHMNHRKDGVIMYNPETNTMLEGIGHYGFQPVEGVNMIIGVCDTPYPCDFDKGIYEAMVRKFELKGNVELNKSIPSRKEGAKSSVYIITW